MQKHKFNVMCLDALFMETAPGPTENVKYFIDVSHPRCTEMHYVTHKYHWMQKHKFSLTWSAAFCGICTGPTRT
jgi:hypothetical protein